MPDGACICIESSRKYRDILQSYLIFGFINNENTDSVPYTIENSVSYYHMYKIEENC